MKRLLIFLSAIFANTTLADTLYDCHTCDRENTMMFSTSSFSGHPILNIPSFGLALMGKQFKFTAANGFLNVSGEVLDNDKVSSFEVSFPDVKESRQEVNATLKVIDKNSQEIETNYSCKVEEIQS